MRFYIDPETSLPHIYNHDVTEDEVEEILTRHGDDFKGRKGRSRIAFGTTRAGRHLKVVYVPDAGRRSAFVVTSFDLEGKVLAAYRRRRRTR